MATISKKTEQASILIVEDEWITARDIEQTLVGLGYRVAGVAASVDTAIAAIDADRPDLALVDISLEGPADGIELARTIQRRWAFPVVYLTAHSDRETVDRLKETGPFGYVSKPFDEGQLRVALELALYNAGKERQRQELAARHTSELEAKAALLEGRLRRVASALGDAPPSMSQEGAHVPPRVRSALDSMSHRELEVLRLLLENRRVAMIAGELSLSVFTVRNHLRSIFRKAGVHSQEELLQLLEPARHLPQLARSDGSARR